MSFPALVPCDKCETLVEPHVKRCDDHRGEYGALTRGRAGHLPPDACSGPFGNGCPHFASPPHGFDRCQRCHRELIRSKKSKGKRAQEVST